ncbi:MAG: sulfotransferase family 2 domain-containing protein [Pseudomonadota bacterium]
MTLISHRAGFIFLKTHKTASTSIEVALEGLCAPEGALTGQHYRPMAISEDGIIGARGRASAGALWRNHMSARAIRRGIGRQIWNRYARITTVRNPYDRMVSMFHSRMSPEERSGISEISFDDVRARFRLFLGTAGPSNNMNKLLLGTRYVIDHILYFEHIAEDFAELAEALGMTDPTLPRLKSDRRTRPEPPCDYYDADTKRMVERSAAFELAFFGYRFGSGPNPPAPGARAHALLRRAPLYAGNMFAAPQKRLTSSPFGP